MKWGGDQPLAGWCVPPGPPSAPRVGNPRGGVASTCLGGHSTPLGRRPPRDPISRAGYPPGGLYKGGGGRAAAPLSLGASLPLLHLFLLPQLLGEALPEYCISTTTTPSCCCWSDLPQPFLPPCWIKKEETSR